MPKLKNLYDLKTFDNAIEQVKSFDSAGGTILGRNLEFVTSQVFEQRVAGVTFLDSGITFDNTGGWADAITKRKKGVNGGFRTEGDNSNTDGKISIQSESDTISVIMREASSDWTEMQLKQSDSEGRNLVNDLVGGHDKLYKQEIDEIGYRGGAVGNGGLLTYTGWSSDASAGAFSTLTGEQMYNEIRDIINLQRAAVLNDPMYSCDSIAMHPDTFNLVSGTLLNAAGGSMSVLEAVKLNLGIKRVVLSFRADVSGTKRLVVYSTFNEGMVMRVPQPLMVSPIDQKGFHFYVESLFRVGGLDVAEDAAAYVLTGV
jgi:hypothetical protein